MEILRLAHREEVRGLIKQISERQTLSALDIETTGLNLWNDKLLSVNIAARDDRAYVFGAEFADELRNLTAPLVMHNFKFDVGFLYRRGIDLRELEIWDTMLIHHLIDENKPHGLDELIQEYFNDDYKEKFWEKYEAFKDAPEEEQDQYSGKDAIYTLRLYAKLRGLLEVTPSVALCTNIHAFAKALLDTELAGVRIDLDTLTARGLEVQGALVGLESRARTAVSTEIERLETESWIEQIQERKTDAGRARVKRPRFSFDSTKQLQRLLYKELQLPVQKNRDSITCDDAALERLEGRHDVITFIRDYREKQKLFSGFLEATLEKARKGVIYPSFNVNGTVTGRISASNPNLQQLPRKGGIRSIYVPEPGSVFISADYSSLESVLAAHFSQDANLLKIVLEGASQHDITAAGMSIPRQLAKTVNYAMQYGATEYKIRDVLKCSLEEAKAAIGKYWETYPGLKVLVDECSSYVDSGRGLVNPFGRVRHLYSSDPTNKWAVAACKRQAFNSLTQGTGADCTNIAFARIAAELRSSKQGRALFVVHDEILIEVKEENAVYWNARLKETMEAVAKEINLTVPLVAEPSGPMAAWLD